MTVTLTAFGVMPNKHVRVPYYSGSQWGTVPLPVDLEFLKSPPSDLQGKVVVDGPASRK